MKGLQHFILATQFLTRIHLTNKNMPCEKEDFRGAMNFFTFLGLIIGIGQYGVYSALLYFAKEPLVAAVGATFMGIFLTGGMHLDGLADIFDGFGAQTSRDRTLEIMKDSRVGSFGVIGLMLDMLLHVAAFTTLAKTPLMIILVPVLGKLTVVLLCYKGICGTKGLGALWIQNIKKGGVLINALIAVGVTLCMLPPFKALILLGSCFLVMSYAKHLFTQKLGGITGDCLGAMEQIGEWVVLILLSCY